MFIIEDQSHAEWHGEYTSVEQAFAELRNLSLVPWDQVPNRCPCTNWKNCNRDYEVIEYETSSTPWKEVRRFGTLNISSKGIIWLADFVNGFPPSSDL